jgi:hypothetical protein
LARPSDDPGTGFFVFGSNGGGEAFAWDARSTSFTIVAVPLIGLARKDAVVIALDFVSFLKAHSSPEWLEEGLYLEGPPDS